MFKRSILFMAVFFLAAGVAGAAEMEQKLYYQKKLTSAATSSSYPTEVYFTSVSGMTPRTAFRYGRRPKPSP